MQRLRQIHVSQGLVRIGFKRSGVHAARTSESGRGFWMLGSCWSVILSAARSRNSNADRISPRCFRAHMSTCEPRAPPQTEGPSRRLSVRRGRAALPAV